MKTYTRSRIAAKAIQLLTLAAVTSASVAAATPPPLKVGVTLHPYYSWTKNVTVGAPIDVRSILPADIDAGDYQPRPEDVAKLRDLDAIVINGVGHDDFITKMIEASGNTKLTIIRPNDGAPMMRGAHGESVNSHTFISFTNAIQQTYAIAKSLSALRPDLSEKLQKNAADYARRLRAIKAKAATQLADAPISRVAAVHDGYAYLMQEFGLEVAAVVQPSHGLLPSAQELKDLVATLKREKVTVVFAEDAFPEPMRNVLRFEAGAQIYQITHIASGEYTAEKFEREMLSNVERMAEALTKTSPTPARK
ncbi:MAG: zinc ABC transporter substrate-binding protein [Deltaproteobacteria bacterium]|nr:zinc ABC transporter substrate-binding protein [Deltaproteobacteria bacterium]